MTLTCAIRRPVTHRAVRRTTLHRFHRRDQTARHLAIGLDKPRRTPLGGVERLCQSRAVGPQTVESALEACRDALALEPAVNRGLDQIERRIEPPQRIFDLLRAGHPRLKMDLAQSSPPAHPRGGRGSLASESGPGN